MDAVIIGGGVNGLFVAYNLLKRGHDVSIIDRSDSPMTSLYNAGLLTPELSPVPPVNLSTLIRSSLSPKGPLYFSPFQIANNLGWVRIAIMKKSMPEDIARKYSAFGRFSLSEYKKFVEETGMDIDMREGVAELYKDVQNGNFESLRKEEIEEMGFSGLRYGAILKEEISVNSHKLVEGLKRLVAEKGGRYLKSQAVGFRYKEAKLLSVKTDDGDVQGEVFVIAAGSWSSKLCRGLGYDPMIVPARGMALLFDTGGSEVVKMPALLQDYGAAVAQHGISLLRATTFFELAGFSNSFSERRREWFISILRRHIAKFDSLRLVDEGVGFRPCTPDQLPVIGRIPGFKNTYIASGHCRVGMTMAAATGKTVADMIEERPLQLDVSFASPSRFLT